MGSLAHFENKNIICVCVLHRPKPSPLMGQAKVTLNNLDIKVLSCFENSFGLMFCKKHSKERLELGFYYLEVIM
jgi:hypothetical protein